MKQSFITSYLAFYLKATVALEGSFIKTSNPNTILKLIPLGSQNKTIPVEQITSVDDSFRLDFKSLVWGIIFTLLGFSMLSSSFVAGLFVLAYGILTILSSFQTLMVLNLTSGGNHSVSVIVFEKAKLQDCKTTIETLLQNRYNDTNVAKQTDRVVEAIANQKN